MVEVEEEERPQTQFVGGGISKRAHTPKTRLFNTVLDRWTFYDGLFVVFRKVFEIHHSPR